MSALQFPPGFTWGSATASYQIEGATQTDGRGPSIWDTFCGVPGAIDGGDDGRIACDHYNRWEEDVDLMAEVGLRSYRFSASWSRVIPTGSGPVNQAGLDFYSRLVDGLLEKGIEPLITLYHWDLPQGLEDLGGWGSRETSYRFGEYAEVMGTALGDRISTFTTLNEPFCSAYLGYSVGVHAPGKTDNALSLRAAHHLNLAHGLGVQALRAATPDGTAVSTTLNLAQIYPATQSEADLAAARHADGIANRVFLDPIFRAEYPADVLEETAHITDWSFVQEGDLAITSQPIDVLGVNFYFPTTVGASVPADALPNDKWVKDEDEPRYYPGTDRAVDVKMPGPYTGMGWPIDPSSLTELLLRVRRDYGPIPMVITENGAAYEDKVGADGEVNDTDRIDYVRAHLAATHAAIESGVDVRGYYLWSFLDNFEWAWGYSRRFGIVRVDYDTLRRTPKASARWYREVIAKNAVED